jgi:hypothetical protein
LDGLLGVVVLAYTWFGAFLSLVGVSMLELSGSPPCVSWIIFMDKLKKFYLRFMPAGHMAYDTVLS